MTPNTELLERNRRFADTFNQGDMPALPRLGTMILTCIDSRVDPAHVLNLQLGEAVIFRNNGGRVTQAFIDEVSALAILISKITGVEEPGFAIVLMQHTECGAQSFADPDFSAAIKARIGVDVSETAITDQTSDLHRDIEKLREAKLPGTIRVSALLYDIKTGLASEVAPSTSLADLRNGRP